MQPEQEQIALSHRAVACKGWRWMPGMLTTQGERVVCANSEYWGARLWVSLLGSDSAGGVFVRSFCDSSGSCLPDLTDPATLGCLLALVREAHGHKLLHLSYRITKSEVGFACYTPRPRPWVSSEAEALVAALEDAP